MGDVKTAFLEGNLGESERDVYGDLPPDARKFPRASADELIKLEGSAFCLQGCTEGVVSKLCRGLEQSWSSTAST